MLCCAVLCCAVLCCAVLCCAVLCCAVLCWAGLGCAVLSKHLTSALNNAGGEGPQAKHILESDALARTKLCRLSRSGEAPVL